jgi:Carboxypeptidase regulatory-like domain
VRTHALLIACSLVGSFPGMSQQPLVGSIQGRITDQHGTPIPYATLTLTNIDSVESESSRQTTGADQRGFYQFVDVPPGRFSILLRNSGYRDYTVPLVTVYPGETVTMPEIKMFPDPSSTRGGLLERPRHQFQPPRRAPAEAGDPFACVDGSRDRRVDSRTDPWRPAFDRVDRQDGARMSSASSFPSIA